MDHYHINPFERADWEAKDQLESFLLEAEVFESTEEQERSLEWIQ